MSRKKAQGTAANALTIRPVRRGDLDAVIAIELQEPAKKPIFDGPQVKGENQMADIDGASDTKDICLHQPAVNRPFFLKGSNSLDWGMQNRLSHIFSPVSGRTVMLAIDHGYFQGPTTGLERIDINIVPLLQYADALMLTRGILRTTIPSTFSRGVVLRASGGPSILKELSNEEIAVGIGDAIRLNVAAVAVQVYIGGEFETRTVHII